MCYALVVGVGFASSAPLLLPMAYITTKEKSMLTKKSFRIGLIDTCQDCGKEYTVRSANQKFCCRTCGLNNYQKTTNHGGFGRYLIFERDNFICFYCGRKTYKDGIEINVDHVIPKSSGGLNTADNLVTCCLDCNASKGFKELDGQTTKDIKAEISKRNKKASIADKTRIRGVARWLGKEVSPT
jgi:5-methylcytosine-specific restriction endonuclease McrA